MLCWIHFHNFRWSKYYIRIVCKINSSVLFKLIPLIIYDLSPFSDNKGNEIVIARFNNDTIESMIDFEKNKNMPDGTKVKLDIKKEGYVTLNSGTKGYIIETNDNNIIFITEKNNVAFRFTVAYTAGNETVSNDILNSFYL